MFPEWSFDEATGFIKWDGGEYCSCFGGGDIKLDGDFTIEELRAIADWMEAFPGEEVADETATA